MQRKISFVLIVLIVCVAFIAIFIYWLMQPGPHELKKRAQLTPDNQLLCEALKLGMSEEDVLNALHRVGEITVNRGEWGNRMQLIISFTDQELEDKYGRFYFYFNDNEYVRASKTDQMGDSGDPSEILCDFYQEPVFITDTP
jgi:hypothetical protein